MTPPTRENSARESRAGRIALLGRPNVGKSTLLNALLGEPIAIVSKHPQTTRDQIHGVLTLDATQYVFIDTPGLHRARTKLGTRMNALAREASQGADVVIFMTDVAAPPRLRISPEDAAILGTLSPSIPAVCVINKIDRVPDKPSLFPILEMYAKARAWKAIIPICALRTNGMDRILSEVREHLPVGPPLFEGDDISDKPVRFFVAEFVREQILRKTRQEVPHGVAVIVERFDETREVPFIEIAIHVDRESHKRIVIGAGGALLKEIGTQARARVEALLGVHVHLQLWVRVTPEWYESDSALRDLGYGEPAKTEKSEKKTAKKQKRPQVRGAAPPEKKRPR